MYAYVIACYLGPRRVPCESYNINRSYYIQKQLEFLKTHKIPKLDLVLVMLNTVLVSELEQTKKIIDSFSPLGYNIELCTRPNIDGSYGAWHDGVIKLVTNYPDIKYALLVEDDYLPCDENVFDDFYKFINDDTFYVCQYWMENCAAISNGLIDLTKAKDIYNKAGRVFMLNGRSDYGYLDLNQRHFLDLVRYRYKIFGLNEDFIHPFNNARNNNIIVYGKGERALLTPIL